MTKTQGRRKFLKQAAVASITAPLFVRNLMSQPPNNRVRHACFGVGGMGASDLGSLASHPNIQIICIAEVDTSRQGAVDKLNRKVTRYQDWRVLPDKEGKNLDSVNVSTPDHMHAPIAMSARQLRLPAS